jgi:N-glycosylase/DNA lyase
MSKILSTIQKRLKEFEQLGLAGYTVYDFSPFLDLGLKATLQTELAFCISTANSSAISGLKFQKSLENLNLSEVSVDELKNLLKSAGVRFYKRKAVYIKLAIDNFEIVKNALAKDSKSAREHLVKNVKGLGYKEASHFLRNVGRIDVAIVDRHILRWLYEKGYLDEIPKNLNPSRYKKIEGILRDIALEKGMTLAELDLHLWYLKTGKVLK